MTSVHVENISAQTSEKEIRDFFSFCGKISHLSVTQTAEGTQSATVTFEKETAAKTALLLDNTQLGSAQVKVSSTKNIDEIAGGKAGEESPKEDSIEQEDKPRARIIAEYLAHGYVVSDRAIEKALELDQKQGLSSRFTSALTNFDTKFKASERAQTIDSKYKVTEKANAGWRSLNSYFDKALGTPTGQKLRQFYDQGSKQVIDVHNEARHLANLKKQPSG
ncbi:actin cytoskeleton protein, partial [Phyllosticta capitalensis]